MNTTIKTWKFGLATGLAFAVLNLLCFLLVLIIGAEAVAGLAGNMAHSIDFTKIIKSEEITFVQVLLGLVETFVVGFVLGAIIAAMYNCLSCIKK